MVKNRIYGLCGISDGGLCDQDWWFPVTGYCHKGHGLTCCGALISFAIYSYLLKIVCVLSFWC